jgi:hypothetical protein
VINLPANCKVVQLNVLKWPGTSGSRKQHHCLVRAMVKLPMMHALGWCVGLFPHVVIYVIRAFIYSFYDLKEYMINLSSFKNHG